MRLLTTSSAMTWKHNQIDMFPVKGEHNYFTKNYLQKWVPKQPERQD